PGLAGAPRVARAARRLREPPLGSPRPALRARARGRARRHAPRSTRSLMSLRQQVALKTMAQVGGKLVSSGLSFASVALLTRHLGLDRYGLYVTAGVYYAFFENLVDFGLTQVLVRRVVLEPARIAATLSNAMTLKLAIGALTFALFAAVGLLIFHQHGREA